MPACLRAWYRYCLRAWYVPAKFHNEAQCRERQQTSCTVFYVVILARQSGSMEGQQLMEASHAPWTR